MDLVIDTNNEVPSQLIAQIKAAFLNGELTTGSPLPSTRQLANDLELDYKTVARAYRLLEHDAVIQTRFAGTFVHPDELRRSERALMQEMKSELQAAHDMQMDLLPEAPPSVDGVDISGICIPANRVSGDYYHYVSLDEEGSKLGIVVADVSGHGMGPATVAMRFSEMLRYEVAGRDDPREILVGLDRSLKGQIQPEMFVTCGIGVLDLARKSLAFASAGNPEVYHFQAEAGEVHTLGVTGMPLGMPLDLEGMDVFGSTETALGSGDVVVFVSDGIEEAQDGTEDFYGQERLMSVIAERSREGVSAEGLRDAIIADVRQFLGDVPQDDDLTVVVLRVA